MPSSPAAGSLASLTIVGSKEYSDTIGAHLPAIVVEVRDSAGKLRSGASVKYSVTTNASAGFKAAPDNTVGSGQYTVTTDASGRAQAVTKLALRTGPFEIYIDAPPFGRDSVKVSVNPGAPHHFAAASFDTALFVDARFALAPSARDRGNNALPDPVTVTSRRPSVAEVLSGSTLHTLATGRVWTLLTAGNAIDSVALSVVPDGSLVAYSFGPRTGGVGFFSFALDGSAYRSFALGATGTNNRSPRWSLATKRVYHHEAFDVASGSTAIFLTDTAGVRQTLVAPSSRLTSAAFPQPSGDGAFIYFSGIGANQNVEIWRAAADGTNQIRVGPAATFGEVDSQPTPSPDGASIAYASNRGGGGLSIRVLTVATGQVQTVAAVGSHPRWSPTSTEIAFFSGTQPTVVRADGTGVASFGSGYNFDTTDGQLDWSLDGKWLVTCVRGSTSGVRNIVIIDRVSGEVLPLKFTARDNLCEATWR